MTDLETIIRDAMLHGDVQALNVFRNPDGGFQANISFRDKGAYKIVRNADPAKALAAAFKSMSAKESIADQFKDVLG